MLNQRAQVERARAEADNARAALAAAKAQKAKAAVLRADAARDLERKSGLFQRELIARSEQDSAQAAHDSAAAQVESAQAQEQALASAIRSAEAQARVVTAQLTAAEATVRQKRAALEQPQVDLAYTFIRAPVDGVVVSRNVDVGQTVAASFNTPTLFLIANDLAQMEINAMVSEADVGGITSEQPVTFTVEARSAIATTSPSSASTRAGAPPSRAAGRCRLRANRAAEGLCYRDARVGGMKLTVQIPALNEEATLAETLRSIPRTIPGIDRVELLVIDDGSSDRTSAVARAAGADHLVRFTRPKGLAAVFMAGLDASLRLGADVIVNTDADNQYDARDLERLIAPILEGPAYLVVGDRDVQALGHFSAIKQLLHTLYGTRDIVAAIDRFERFGFERMLHVVDVAQEQHFKQLFASLKRLGWPWAGRCEHVAFGQVLVGGSRAKTREGESVELIEVLREGEKRALAVVEEKNAALKDKEAVARAVGTAAVIFCDVGFPIRKNIHFDWNEILSFDGRTGPYLQYVHPSACSILRKGGGLQGAAVDASRLSHDLEWDLVRRVAEFPAAVPTARATASLSLSAAFFSSTTASARFSPSRRTSISSTLSPSRVFARLPPTSTCPNATCSSPRTRLPGDAVITKAARSCNDSPLTRRAGCARER